MKHFAIAQRIALGFLIVTPLFPLLVWAEKTEDLPKVTSHGQWPYPGNTVGEWPSHLFIGNASNGPTIENVDYGSDAFISNPGTVDDGQDAAQKDCGLGNPILPSTGNKIEPETDFVSTGEMPLFLKRTYNRYWDQKGLFGYYWLSNFDLRIAKTPDNKIITAYRSDGRKVKYVYSAVPSAGWYENKAQAVSRIVASGSGYLLYGEDDSLETYNAAGQITSLKNQQGIGNTFAYSGGRLQQATHTSGRKVLFAWTGDLLTSVTDPAGNVFTYSYWNSAPGIHQLVFASQPGTPITTITYHYEMPFNPGALTGKSYSGVRYSTFTYDGLNYATSSVHSGGADKHTFVYSFVNGTTSVLHTNPLGKKTTLVFKGGKLQSETGQASLYCPGATYREITYDANGYQDKATDFADGITDYDYNAKGQLLKKTEAAGMPYARVTQYQWDPVKNRITRETATGYRQTDYTYTANGRPYQIKVTNLSGKGVANQVHTTTYSYTTHPNGLLKTVATDGPLSGDGDAVTQEYDALGNQIAVRNKLSHAVSYSNFNGLGLPGRITGINGAIVDYTYDARGRVLAEKHYVSGVWVTTTNVYDNRGRRIKTTSPDGVTTTYAYDANNRLVTITRPDKHSAYASLGSDFVAFERFFYDLAGNPIKIEKGVDYLPLNGFAPPEASDAEEPGLCHPQPDCEMDPPNPQPARKVLVTWRTFIDYDELGRVRARRGNAGQNVRYTYDANGNVKTLVDSLNKTTTLAYDALGQLIQSTDPKAGITKFAYDAGGQLIQVTDPRNVITRYDLDGFGQLWKQTSPDSGTSTFQYNAAGQRTQLTRADGAATTYAYNDPLGRLTGITAAGQVQGFTYDACTGGKGLLCRVTDPNGQLDYTYSPQGWRLTQKQKIGASGIAFDQAYAYDVQGRLTGISYPGNIGVGYGYADGQLAAMTVNLNGSVKTVVNGLTYQPFGPAASWNYGNGLARGFNHDLDGRVFGLSTKNANSVLQSLTYAFNANDAVTKITNGANAGLTQTYGYDELSRLTTVTATNANQSLGYDKTGNRTSHTWGGLVDTYATAGISNKLAAISGPRAKTFMHSANGNITSVGGVAYAYNAFNRLGTATKDGINTNYWVNALGQRTYKTQGAPKAKGFMYGLGGELAVEYDWSGPGWTHYLRLGGEPIAIVRGSQLYFVHNDHLGRPELATNSAKVAVWRASNYAFDRTVTLDSIGGLNLGFPGQYYDAETGNWHNGFRDYDKSIGRYLQTDPIGLAGGLNTYAYVEANPVNLTDRFGLESGAGYATGAYQMAQPSMNDCQAEATVDFAINLTEVGAIAQIAMDALGVDVDVVGGLDVSVGEYGEIDTPAAAAGHIADGVARRYEQRANQQAARAGQRGIHYSVANGRLNRSLASRAKAAIIKRGTGALGPAGAIAQWGMDTSKCGCSGSDK